MAPSSETATPPFVLWSLAAQCPYREEAEASEPQRVERVLRPLRAAAEALAEGRCLHDVCVQADYSPALPAPQVTGFLVGDTLMPFGGADSAEQTCGPCPSNAAMPPEQQPRWAGCHGMLILEDQTACQQDLPAAWGRAAERAGRLDPFPPAAVAWHRLWIETPLSAAQLQWHAWLWESGADEAYGISGLAAWQRAVSAASAQNLALHVQAYPSGLRAGRHWHVPAHCRRCSAPRDEHSAACRVCHSVEAAEPARRRFAKGERPYWQLGRFLGEEGAEKFLRRYAQHRAAVSRPRT